LQNLTKTIIFNLTGSSMRTKSLKTRKVLAYLQANPSAKLTEVAKKFKMTPSYVYKLRINTKLDKALKDGRLPLTKSSTKREAVDKVNHPPHYKVGGIETIDFIEAKSLNYNLGNVVKYLTRADHKGNKLEDLQKAQWYLARELKNLSK
jgi:hypothetical protein